MMGATWGWVREEDCTFLLPMVNADLNPVVEIQKIYKKLMAGSRQNHIIRTDYQQTVDELQMVF